MTTAAVSLKSVRNVTLINGCASVKLIGCIASGTVTLPAGVTGTVIDNACVIATLSDSTTAAQGTVYPFESKIRTITTSDTLNAADNTILCNLAGGSNLQLPAPATVKGKKFRIRDIGATGFATRNLTIVRAASELINGVGASLVLATSATTTVITSDGTNWYTLGLSTPG